MAEKCTEFLAQVAQPLVERAGFAVFGITQDFDMLGVQVIVPDEDEHFVRSYNAQARPFTWIATADSILQKVQRLCERISGTRH